jgi:multidrug efflux pump subunit AcrB
VRITEFAVRRWQFTLVMFGLMIALGAFSLWSIPRAEDPTFAYPAATIVIVYPGAEPEEMERLVVKPIEDAVNELENLKKLDSFVADGSALIGIEFEAGEDANRKFDEVMREFNALRPSLPQDLAVVDIRRVNPGLVNIAQVALVSDTADYRQLKELADDLKDRFAAVAGVRRAEIWGFPSPEVRVTVDLERLSRSGATLLALGQAIQSENASIPGGAADAGLRRFNLKTSGSYRTLADIENTVVAASAGRVVRVRDVATVSWATEEHTYTARYNGRRAVFVVASAKDNQNVFRVRDGLDAAAAQMARELPAGVRLERGFDQTRNVAHRLTTLGRDFGIAIALVVLTLLPLGLRAAGIVMVSIPLSLAIGLGAIYMSGYSLNQLTIAAFVIALGLLVDDSIVVVENIARFARQGMGRAAAAIAATRQISLAVLGCTATVCLAFLPLMMLSGAAGEFVRILPATIIYTVLASLFVSLTIVPFLTSRLLRDATLPDAAQRDSGLRARLWRLLDRSDALADRTLERVMRVIHEVYRPALRRALAAPRTTLYGSLALCAATVGLVPLIGFSLFPVADIPQFMVRVSAPEGASRAETARALAFVEAELGRHPEVRQYFSNLGHANPFIYYNVFPGGTNVAFAEVFVELDRFDGPRSERLIEELRTKFQAYPAARIVVKQFEQGAPVDAPIAVRIVGPDLATLRTLAGRVERVFEATPGTRDVHNPVRLLRTDIDLGIDTEKAALYGIAAVEADRTVRMAVAGQPVGRFRVASGDEYDITLRLPLAEQQTLDVLERIQVGSATGRLVPLGQIAEPRFETSPNLVRRFNRERNVTISAYPRPGFNTDKLTRQIVKQLEAVPLPPGYRYDVAGEFEQREESFGGVGVAALVAMFGIFAVLVLEFGSFRSTLIVAGVIPLGIMGALLALFATGYTLSFTALIGMVALIGIEIKNSILLVDFTNQLREQGLALDAAIERAGEVRFLPILLTSATAIGGMLPLAIQHSNLYSPLAIVIIGGLITSTLLARLVTPVMYKLLPPEIEPAAPAGTG